MLRSESLRDDLADLFDEAAPQLTLEEVRDRAFQIGPIRHSRLPRPSVMPLAFVAVLLTALLVGALTQPWDRQAPLTSQPEVASPELTDTTAIMTTDAPPVPLGADHLWPETPRNDTPSELAQDFATSVLGWQDIDDPWAIEFPDGVTWVRIQLADSPELFVVATTVTPDGNHVIVEAGHGVDLSRSETGGTKVGLAMVPGASEGEIIVRMSDGSYEVETVAFDPDNPSPVDTDLPQVDPSSIDSVLIRYKDETGQVIRVYGTSTPQMDEIRSSDERGQAYVVDGEQLLATQPTVVIGAQSPEPRFDTSDLGEEVTLIPITDVARILRRAEFYPGDEIVRVTVLGTTPQGIDALVAYNNFYYDTENGPKQYRYMLIGDDITGIGSPLDELTNAPGGLVPREPIAVPWTASGGESRRSVVWYVPPDTSVVVMNVDGERTWQRPIDATAIFDYDYAYSSIDLQLTALNSSGETVASYTGRP